MLPDYPARLSLRTTLLIRPTSHSLLTPSRTRRHNLRIYTLLLCLPLRPCTCRLVCRGNSRCSHRLRRIPSAMCTHHRPCVGIVAPPKRRFDFLLLLLLFWLRHSGCRTAPRSVPTVVLQHDLFSAPSLEEDGCKLGGLLSG
ncbi:hypothetical protein BD309DRAFT_609940 [Dichomitus squalens]|uniref:Uncharacterized protein n=1 Tax=Dichomitus squalens TaxID=114155 RepID=A0A4Q9NDW9_9APHY|nr:hypothetical protein BD309DRAFT_609940 [Dichomitus squalens]TBU59591.1 hypothetical protein BD310DRAFT_383902 [Dichomitus squalens]